MAFLEGGCGVGFITSCPKPPVSIMLDMHRKNLEPTGQRYRVLVPPTLKLSYKNTIPPVGNVLEQGDIIGPNDYQEAFLRPPPLQLKDKGKAKNGPVYFGVMEGLSSKWRF